MSDAKRYDVTEKYIGTGEYVGAMEESATGDWVAFSDYAPLKARLEEAERVKEAGHDGQHTLVDVTRPDDRWRATDEADAVQP